MAANTRYAGPTPDGTYISRRTPNDYGCAIAVIAENPTVYRPSDPAADEHGYIPNPVVGQWVSLSWHRTPALAQRKLTDLQGRGRRAILVPVIEGKPPVAAAVVVEPLADFTDAKEQRAEIIAAADELGIELPVTGRDIQDAADALGIDVSESGRPRELSTGGDGFVDAAPLGEQHGAYMCEALLYDKTDVGDGEIVLVAWEPSLAGQDGIPYGWRLRRAANGQHWLDKLPVLGGKAWSTEKQMSKGECRGLIEQLKSKQDVEVAFAADATSTERSTEMTASAGATTRGKSAASKTTAKQGDAAMATAQAKTDGKAVMAEVAKAIKTIRGIAAKPSPNGSYITYRVGKTPVAYTTVMKGGVRLELALTDKPEGIDLPFESCPTAGPRFGWKAVLATAEQAEAAKAAVELAAKAVAK